MPTLERRDALRLINEQCDRFEDAWLQGERPEISEFLRDDIQHEVQEELFSSILELEVDYRQQHNETLDLDSLKSRFPMFQSVIEQYAESVSSKDTSAAQPAALQGTAIIDLSTHLERTSELQELLDKTLLEPEQRMDELLARVRPLLCMVAKSQIPHENRDRCNIDELVGETLSGAKSCFADFPSSDSAQFLTWITHLQHDDIAASGESKVETWDKLSEVTERRPEGALLVAEILASLPSEEAESLWLHHVISLPLGFVAQHLQAAELQVCEQLLTGGKRLQQILSQETTVGFDPAQTLQLQEASQVLLEHFNRLNPSLTKLPENCFDGHPLESLLACHGIATQHLTSLLYAPLQQSQKNPQTHPSRLEVGREFGRYTILKMLGKGGMGAVYLATDKSLDRQVALKIPTFDETEQDLLARFMREAKSAAQLHHRNICPLYDIGVHEQQHYLTMAFVQGETLAELLDRETSCDQRTTAIIVRKLALATQYAHERHIVHRDIKPANVLIDEEGEPVLMDFGLARRELSQKSNVITQSGMIIGTPAYMPPEQIDDSTQAGPSSDIYSLGVLMYQMLTGTLPFTGSLMSLLSKIVNQPAPTIQSVKPAIASELSLICATAMEKAPEDRFANMQEFAKRIEDWLQENVQVVNQVDTEIETSAGGRTRNASRQTSAPVSKAVKTQSEPASLGRKRGVRHIPVWATAVTGLGFLGGLIYLSIVLFVQTPKGTLRVQIEDPSIEVTVVSDGLEILVDQPDKILQVGIADANTLSIKHNGIELQSDSFKLTEGQQTRIQIELLEDQVIAVRNGDAFPLHTQNPQRIDIPNEMPADNIEVPSRSEIDPAKFVAQLLELGIRFSVNSGEKDNESWKELSSNDVILENIDRINKIDAWSTNFEDSHLREAVILFPNLEVLYLDGTHVTASGIAMVSKLRNLKRLHASRLGLDDSVFDKLCEIPALERVALDDNPQITGKGLGGLQQVTQIALNSNPIELSSLKELSPQHPLVVLELRDCGLDDRVFPHLATLSELERLDLSRNRITGPGFEKLDTFPRLKEIVLSGNPLKQDAIERLLEKRSSITALDLSSCNLDDACLPWVAGFKKLELLYLADNRLTGANFELLRNLDRLHYLDVANNPIEHGAAAKITIPPNLRDLNLSNCRKISDLNFLSDHELWAISIQGTSVTDLTPLNTTQLEAISLTRNWIKDLGTFINRCPKLKAIGHADVEELRSIYAQPTIPRNGGPIDLLDAIRIPENVLYGEWRRENGVIRIVNNEAEQSAAYCLRLPITLPRHYRLRFQANQCDDLTIALPIGDTAICLNHQHEGVATLFPQGTQRESDPKSGHFDTKKPIAECRDFELEVHEFAPESIQLRYTVDGEQLIDYRGPAIKYHNDFTQWMLDLSTNGCLLKVYVNSNWGKKTTEFSNIRFQVLEGQSHLLSGDAKADQALQQIDSPKEMPFDSLMKASDFVDRILEIKGRFGFGNFGLRNYKGVITKEEILKNLKQITSLDVRSTAFNDLDLQHAGFHLPNLEEIFLDRTKVTSSGFNAIGRLQSLRHVDAEGLDLDDSAFACLAELPSLSDVRLKKNPKLTGKGIGNLKQLTNYLHLSGCSIAVENLKEINADLAGLDLSLCGLNDESLRSISHLKNLGSLRLVGNEINGLGLQHLADFTRLTTLHLSNNPLSSGMLADLQIHSSTLSFLFLQDCGLEDDALVGISKLSSLRELYLNGNKLSGRHLDRLNDLDNLYKLDLSSNPLQQAILTNASILPGLTDLNLAHCQSIADLRFLANASLSQLSIQGTSVTDLTPLNTTQLEAIGLTPNWIKDLAAFVKSCPKLKAVGGDKPEQLRRIYQLPAITPDSGTVDLSSVMEVPRDVYKDRIMRGDWEAENEDFRIVHAGKSGTFCLRLPVTIPRHYRLRFQAIDCDDLQLFVPINGSMLGVSHQHDGVATLSLREPNGNRIPSQDTLIRNSRSPSVVNTLKYHEHEFAPKQIQVTYSVDGERLLDYSGPAIEYNGFTMELIK